MVPGSALEAAVKNNLHEPFGLAHAFTVAAEDHLATIVTVYEAGPLPLYSPYTLLRAAGEAICHGSELLDPSISDTVRLAHALNERLFGLDQQRKSDPDEKSARAFFVKQVDHLVKRAQANGITPVYNKPKNGKPELVGFGKPRKKDFQLFSDCLPGVGGEAFRFLSPHVHSTALQQLLFAEAQPTTNLSFKNVPSMMNGVDLAKLIDAFAEVHDKNIGQFATYAGLSADEWDQVKAAVTIA
jgi:hypothetical protein